jgi:regulator of chromosome condensation
LIPSHVHPLTSKAREVARILALPVINNTSPTKLDVYVFGENSAGELGLGAGKDPNGKSVSDVKRPRINHHLFAKSVGVVQIAVGGMHCVALTHDNKIYTWGVNDQGALGRATDAGPMKDMDDAAKDDDSDSDSDAGDNLNASEATPHEIDTSNFSDGIKFSSVYAGDSVSFALTTTGLVYGWGTFRVSLSPHVYSVDSNICRAMRVSSVSVLMRGKQIFPNSSLS